MNNRADLNVSAPHTQVVIARHLSADGEVWTVREVPAPADDRSQPTHLIFMSSTTMRRVRRFPCDWVLLDDDELYRLSLELYEDR